MARQLYVTGHEGDARRAEAIVRLCSRATEIDPSYSRAWALMAIAQMILRFDARQAKATTAWRRPNGRSRWTPNLAEAHAVKARILSDSGRHDEAAAEIDIALRLDPESYEVNRSAAYLRFRQQRLDEAIRYYERR